MSELPADMVNALRRYFHTLEADVEVRGLTDAELRGAVNALAPMILDMAAELVQRDYPHDKRALVPAILFLKGQFQ